MIYKSHYPSPLGGITLAGSENAIIGLWFDGQKYFALPEHCQEKALPVFDDAKRWLDIYFQGKNPGFMPLLHFDATPFRQAVWEILLSIPYGQTMTYGQIAQQLAAQRGLAAMSAQAVGGAVGHNPISILIPCHRVVGANGSLTGYAGGVDRKLQLLKLEKADLSALFIPKRGTAL